MALMMHSKKRDQELRFMARCIRRMWKWFRPILYSILFVFLALIAFLFIGWPVRSPSTTYGITWSKTYADYLGIDETDGLKATLTDLKIKHYRLPAYWTEIQPKQNVWRYEWLESQLDLIQNHGAKAIIVVGGKQPRWPECWIPQWAKQFSQEERMKAQLAYVQKTVEQLARRTTIIAWQVENEPGFAFGDCDGQSRKTVIEEMNWVRAYERERSKRPVYTTESGELSTWLGFAGHADGIGVSVYRVVIVPIFGIYRYFYIPPWFYTRKASIVRMWTGPAYVSELQMEPWVTKSILNVKSEDQFKTFSIQQMQKNFWYATHIALPVVDFWGAEWWYWMKTQKNHPEFWNVAKQFFNRSYKIE